MPQYYVEGNHEAIITKEIYLQVQEELVRRRVIKTIANGKKRCYSYNHYFSLNRHMRRMWRNVPQAPLE